MRKDPDHDYRPECFTSFDRCVQQLAEQIPDRAIRAAVLTTLDEDGRQVDMQQLAARYRLNRAAVRLIRRLVRFGDVGHPVHNFGSIYIAEIVPRATRTTRSVTTYLYATRRGTKVDLWWADTADGFGALGLRNQPLTPREAVVMLEKAIRAQATYDVIDDGDRSAYAPGRASTLRIRSKFHPQLEVQFRRRTQRRRRRSGGRRT